MNACFLEAFARPNFDTTILDLLPEAYLILNRDYVIVGVNDSYLDQTLRTRREFVGRPIFDIESASLDGYRTRNEWLRLTFSELTPSKVVRSSEYRQVIAPELDRNEIFKVWVIEAKLISQGNPQHDIIVIRLIDVTEAAVEREKDYRARAELRSTAQLRAILVEEARAEIRSEKVQFEEVLAFAQIGSWQLDKETGTMLCSTQCRKNLGMPADGLLTEVDLFHNFVDLRDRGAVHTTFSKALTNKTFFETEYRTRWPDGSLHWIMLRGNGRYDDRGNLTVLYGFTLDITSRKVAELLQASEVLVEKEARAASDNRVTVMDSFLSSVSHEIRSPLNAILSWSQVMRRSASMQVTTRASDAIERNARQLSLMVDDLLDTGALANGAMSVRRERVDFGAIVTSTMEDMRHDIEEKGLGLNDNGIVSCWVEGDESRLRQIVYNLLSNAAKYTSNGAIDVALTRISDEIALTVKDTGVGISDSLLPHIFEKFQQATQVGSGRIGGLGLGLWLVKNLVQLHRGRVAVTSEGLGRGARFEVTLPVLEN